MTTNTQKRRLGMGQKPRPSSPSNELETPEGQEAASAAQVRAEDANNEAASAELGAVGGSSLDPSQAPKSEVALTPNFGVEAGLEELLEASRTPESISAKVDVVYKKYKGPDEPLVKVTRAEIEAAADIVAPMLRHGYPQPNGDLVVPVTVQDQYVEAVRQWAEADGKSVAEWLSHLLYSYLESYGQPAQGR